MSERRSLQQDNCVSVGLMQVPVVAASSAAAVIATTHATLMVLGILGILAAVLAFAVALPRHTEHIRAWIGRRLEGETEYWWKALIITSAVVALIAFAAATLLL